MDRDLKWLWENQKEGARSKFEEVCYEICLKEFPCAEVHKVEVTQGDGGVDIFIEEPDGKLTVIQCKYFIGRLDDGRKNNIRGSFKTAVEQNKMDTWILCVAMDFSNGELNWWRTWKSKQGDKGVKIKLYDESKLKSLLKRHDLFDEYLNTVRIDESFVDGIVNKDEKTKIHNRLYHLISAIRTGDYDTFDIVSAVDQLGDLKEHRIFKGSHLLDYLDALSILYSLHAEGNGLYGRKLKDENLIQQETSFREKIYEEYKKLDF